MKLLIVSDTHGINTDKLLKIIKQENADINIHAGDYLLPITEMKKMFQYFVDGNNDYGYKDEQTFTIGGSKFLLLHGHQYFSFDYQKWINSIKNKISNIDVIIFGHSHIPLIDTSAKPFFINPGSLSLPRNSNKKTYVIATIENNNISFELKTWID